MSQNAPPPPPQTPIQFDVAEYSEAAPATSSCAVCNQQIVDSYFTANGAVVCPACRDKCSPGAVGGSKFSRAFLATLYGWLAGMVGAANVKVAQNPAATPADATEKSNNADLDQATDSSAGPATAPASSRAAKASLPLKILGGMLLLVLAFLFALALPFLGGLSNLIGLLIIGFALYEAWKINKRTIVEFAGPFRSGANAAPPPPVSAA